jgi:hypothetical protein
MTWRTRRAVVRSVRLPLALRLALVCLLLGGPASAQPAAPAAAAADWTRGTTLNLFGGAAFDRVHTSAAAGGAFGWEVTQRFALEATGSWFARGPGADGFAADLTALLSLRRTRTFVPFVKAGAGLYRASFDPSRSPMPGFYRNRLALTAPFDRHAAFTDPTIVVGGGLVLWLSENVSLRPELDVKIAIDGSEAHPLGIAGVRVAYHFVDRPTESRSR